METIRTKTIQRETNIDAFASNETDTNRSQERLDTLLSANAQYARRHEIFKNHREETEAAMMTNPMSSEKVFSYFGFLLGTFPPAVLFGKFLFEEGNFRGDEIGVILLLMVTNFISALVGYFSGRTIGKIVSKLENQSWSMMLLTLPFVGILWGLIAGGSGGLFIFIIGAIFGGIIGGMVGGVALPAFTIFHRLLKRGDSIDSKHFYPIAFGIIGVISALILGF